MPLPLLNPVSDIRLTHYSTMSSPAPSTTLKLTSRAARSPSKEPQSTSKLDWKSHHTIAPKPWPLPNSRPATQKSTKPLDMNESPPRTAIKRESQTSATTKAAEISGASNSATLNPPKVPPKDWKPRTQNSRERLTVNDVVQQAESYAISTNTFMSPASSRATTPRPVDHSASSSETLVSKRFKEDLHSDYHGPDPRQQILHSDNPIVWSTTPKPVSANEQRYHNPFRSVLNPPPSTATHKSSRVQSSGLPIYLPSHSNVNDAFETSAAYFVTKPLKLVREELREEDVPASAAACMDEGICTAAAHDMDELDEQSVAHLRPESKRRRRVRSGISLQSDFAYSGDSVYLEIGVKNNVVQFPSLYTSLEILQKLGPQSKRNGCDLKAYGMEPIIGACESFLSVYKTLLHQLSDSEQTLDGKDHPAKLAREFEKLIRKERLSPFADDVYSYHRDVKQKAETMCDRMGRYYYLVVSTGTGCDGLEDT